MGGVVYLQHRKFNELRDLVEALTTRLGEVHGEESMKRDHPHNTCLNCLLIREAQEWLATNPPR